MNNIEIPIIFVKMCGALYKLSCTIASTLKSLPWLGDRTQDIFVILFISFHFTSMLQRLHFVRLLPCPKILNCGINESVGLWTNLGPES